MSSSLHRWGLCSVAALVLVFATERTSPAQEMSVSELRTSVGVAGGLCAQWGTGDLQLAQKLAQTGRFVVQVLDPEEKNVQAARKQVAGTAEYGMLSVVPARQPGKLPYTERLVNLLVIAGPGQPDLQDAFRAVCPNGAVLFRADNVKTDALTAVGFTEPTEIQLTGKTYTRVRKPWPKELDEWTHPRHSANGNAVSKDTVVGPPQRIRWVVAAQAEIRGLVSSQGRNFYAGVLTRDGFNGLRLWDRDLIKPNATGPYVMQNLPREMPSLVTNGPLLFSAVDKKLQAIDTVTGETVRTFDSPEPREVLVDGKFLVVRHDEFVRAFDVETGKTLWTHQSSMPRELILGEEMVALVEGNPRRGEKVALAALDRKTGQMIWKRIDYPWVQRISRAVYHSGTLAYEISTFNNDGPGCELHLIDSATGTPKFDKEFLPGMNHKRQARAMFVNDQLWILHGGKDAENKRLPPQISSIDFDAGKVEKTFNAGLAHCFPPVATPKYLFSGELDLTDLETGLTVANRITKAACGGDFGWMPANGLIYLTPKHCVCWPMLRGYVALAADREGGNPALLPLEQLPVQHRAGVAAPANPPQADELDWPTYRGNAWRSGSTEQSGPEKLDVLWETKLMGRVSSGPIAQDWAENPYIKGPVSAPVQAAGSVYITRPDAHEVVCLNATDGKVRWRFTADGRVDTPPTIHGGLCLFGTHSGTVYSLRADNGQLVWQLHVAPLDEQIVAYGQVESPWPIPGNVVVIDDRAYFAAGRQSLADGGILVFAVEPATGEIHWRQRLDSVPQKGFYRSSGLEFDNFDLLYRDGDCVAMSRWLWDRKTGEQSVREWDVFAALNTGDGIAMVPRGSWSYAPRHQTRTKTHEPLRPLVSFRDHTLFGASEDRHTVYRRDFDIEGGEKFDTHWITGWAGGQESRKEDGVAWPSQRLMQKAAWKVPVVDADNPATVVGTALAGDRLYLATSAGQLKVLSTKDGSTVAECEIPEPQWDGLIVAQGRVLLSTQDGRVFCLGPKQD